MPDLEGFAEARKQHAGTGRLGNGQADLPLPVPKQDVQPLSALDVPQPRRAVAATRQRLLAVRRERNRDQLNVGMSELVVALERLGLRVDNLLAR